MFILVIVQTVSRSQGFIIFDSKDYINPTWLDPQYLATDSIKKMYFLSTFGGMGVDIHNYTGDDVYPNRFFNTFWYTTSLYSRKFQWTIKNSYLFGANYRVNNEEYILYQNFNPQFQVGCYPFFKSSYLGNQMRMQLSWAPEWYTRGPDDPKSFRSSLQMEYGGIINNYDSKNQFPKTVFVTQFYKSLDSSSFFTYGFTVFTGIPVTYFKSVKNTLYFQLGYNRNSKHGNDIANILRLGLLDEIFYGATHQYAVYFFVNYTVDYNIPIRKLGEIIDRKNDHGIRMGVFFNFPFYSKFLYKYKS